MNNPFVTIGYSGPEYFCDREDNVPKPFDSAFMKRYALGALSSTKLALNTLVKNNIVVKSEQGYYIYDRYLSLWLQQ